MPTPLKGSNAHFTRMAAILSYAAEEWNALGEFDYGQNAFHVGQLCFGAAARRTLRHADRHRRSPQGNRLPATRPAHRSRSMLSDSEHLRTADRRLPGDSEQRPRARNRRGLPRPLPYPGTKLTAFGMFQWFMPNDNVNKNPLDFQRFVVGPQLPVQRVSALRARQPEPALLPRPVLAADKLSVEVQLRAGRQVQRLVAAEDRQYPEPGAARYARDLLEHGVRVLIAEITN